MAVMSPRAEIEARTNGSGDGDIPPLENGDRLTRAEFERRYEAMRGVNRAELVEGVVYMPSAVHFAAHSEPHGHLVTCLGIYAMHTRGVKLGDNGSVRLDLDNEPQPDAFLLILPERGGQCRISEDDYVEGAPELVAEAASSSVSYDLGDKLKAYRRNGVREYVVWRVRERQMDWFVLRDDQFVRLPAGEGGILRSVIFPGLWLDPIALVGGDLARVSDVLRQGLDSGEHKAFVRRLESASS